MNSASGLEAKYEDVTQRKIPASSIMHAVNMYAEMHYIVHFTHRQTVLQDTKKYTKSCLHLYCTTEHAM